MKMDLDATLKCVATDRDAWLRWLMEWGRIPSISSNPDYAQDVWRAAEFLRDKMTEMRLEARIIETAGHPITFGSFGNDPNRETLLFYGHLDVQPVGDLALWTMGQPFEPTIRGDNIYFRGSMDDKGQVWTFLRAIAAIMQVHNDLPFNVRIVIEAEEEVGSGNFYAFLKAEETKQLLAGTTAILVCDTDMPEEGQPALMWGLRGMTYVEVAVSGPSHELHSGHAGGRVQNPIQALAYMLTRCRNEQTGEIIIPGFYDDVAAPTETELALLATDPTTAAQLIAEFGVPRLWTEPGVTPNLATSFRPTFEVNGMWGGHTGPGSKTVIPPWACAKISCRLVRNQDPAKIAQLLEAHLRNVMPDTVTMEFKPLHGGSWVEVDPNSKPVLCAARALEAAFGRKPAFIRSGGSIPVVAPMQMSLGVNAVLMGWGLPDGNIHSPNENLHLPTAESGTQANVHFAYEFSA